MTELNKAARAIPSKDNIGSVFKCVSVLSGTALNVPNGANFSVDGGQKPRKNGCACNNQKYLANRFA
jgi:hypothetical protein